MWPHLAGTSPLASCKEEEGWEGDLTLVTSHKVKNGSLTITIQNRRKFGRLNQETFATSFWPFSLTIFLLNKVEGKFQMQRFYTVTGQPAC